MKQTPSLLADIVLIGVATTVAAFIIYATWVIPGMFSLSPGITGVVAAVIMLGLVGRAVAERTYLLAWLMVVAAPVFAVSGFLAAYVWSFLAPGFPNLHSG